jgi:hypothetical protein
LVSILPDEVVFVGAGKIIITTMLIVEIMAMTIIPHVSNLDNRDIDSPLVIPLEQQDSLGSKVTVLVNIIAM